MIDESLVSVHFTSCSIESIFQLIKAFKVLGESHIISIGVYVSFSSSSLISSFSLCNKILTFEINCHSTCNDSSLNIPKYDDNILEENLSESTGVITPFVEIVISKESRFVISPNLVSFTSYFTLITGEKFASISKTQTSSSIFFNSSIDKYQTDFSTLISISRFIPSLSISVMYKSLFKISIQACVFISDALTTQALFLDNFIHSIPGVFLSIIKLFKFNIISNIVSFTQGSVEYS